MKSFLIMLNFSPTKWFIACCFFFSRSLVSLLPVIHRLSQTRHLVSSNTHTHITYTQTHTHPKCTLLLFQQKLTCNLCKADNHVTSLTPPPPPSLSLIFSHEILNCMCTTGKSLKLRIVVQKEAFPAKFSTQSRGGV